MSLRFSNFGNSTFWLGAMAKKASLLSALTQTGTPYCCAKDAAPAGDLQHFRYYQGFSTIVARKSPKS